MVATTQLTRDESSATIDALLDAAERMFATEGVDAVSLRAITSAAGANVAAIHYHFGSREDLLEALVARRMDALAERRAAVIAALPAVPTVDSIAEALVRPLIEEARTPAGRNYVRVLRQLTNGTPTQRMIPARRFQPQHRLLTKTLAAARPDLSDGTRGFRLRLASESVLSVLSAPELFRSSFSPPLDLDQLGDELVAHITATLGGPA